MMEHLPALQVVIPLLGATVVAMTRRGGLAWFIALSISLLMPAIAITLLHQVFVNGVISYEIGGWEPPFGIEYRVDVANAFVLVIVSLIAALVLPYARLVVEKEVSEENRAWFYSMYLLCLCGLLGIAITGDAFNAFVFLEISSLSTYTMIAMGRDRRSLVAAFQYLIMGTIGATLYIIGVGIIYVMTGTLNFADMAERIQNVSSVRPVLVALSFITVGLSLKIALFPLHKWLPNAYAYAPSVATIFLASTATKVAIYLLVRFYYTVYGPSIDFEAYSAAIVLVGLSLAAMFIASFVACYQKNIERMLAFSSVAQIGYITLGISFGVKTGLTGGLVHLVNHAFMKGALFMCTGAIMYRLGSVKLDDLAGIGRRMPVTMALFAAAGLSLIGVPGTVGFVSKYYLATAAIETGQTWLAFAIMLSSLLAVVYIGRVIEVAYFREPTAKVMMVEDPPASMLIPTVILVLACYYFGIDAELTSSTAAKAADAFLSSVSGGAR
ncbi:MAG: monovalent cation/H+ antiporter subunit D family protein [Rhizobiales bacterium]|nr:monovalent cation/H+ antiporter subunit D family protein [Hyphomicrobiales bacterium]